MNPNKPQEPPHSPSHSRLQRL
ncbi:MAG: hypothetical protein ACD_75C00984G0002, partial [uncultured bacterium]